MNSYALLTYLIYGAILLIVVGAVYATLTLNVLAFAVAGLAGFVIAVLYASCLGLYDKLRKMGGIK